jgi:hypothetical protein
VRSVPFSPLPPSHDRLHVRSSSRTRLTSPPRYHTHYPQLTTIRRGRGVLPLRLGPRDPPVLRRPPSGGPRRLHQAFTGTRICFLPLLNTSTRYPSCTSFKPHIPPCAAHRSPRRCRGSQTSCCGRPRSSQRSSASTWYAPTHMPPHQHNAHHHTKAPDPAQPRPVPSSPPAPTP